MHMKKYLQFGLATVIGALFTIPTISLAVGGFPVATGGTGQVTLPVSQLIYGSGTSPVQSTATTSVTCSGATSCTSFTVIGPSPITISSASAGAWPFIPSTNFNVAVQSTSTPIWDTAGLQASSTSQFVNQNIWGLITLKASTTPMLVATDGAGNLVSTSSPTFAFFTATSTTASSTAANGINVTNGCFAIGGTCLQAIISSASAFKAAVTYASTTTLPSYVYNNGASGVGATITSVSTLAFYLDGNNPPVGTRVLIKNETGGNQPNNGIYTVTTAGVNGVTAFVLTRATDYNNSNDIFPGVANFVNSGTVNANTCWILTNTTAIVVGTTNLTYADTCGSGSFTGTAPITVSGTTISIATASASQTGAITGSDWTKFNMKVGTSSAETANQVPFWTTTNGAPANLSGGISGFTVNSGTSVITMTSASTTNSTVSSLLVIPVNAAPSLSEAGNIAVNTTAASSSLNYYDGTVQGKLFNVTDFGFTYINVPTAGQGTTTFIHAGGSRGFTLVSGSCFSNGGTAKIQFGNGTASTTMLTSATTITGQTQTTLSSNNSFQANKPTFVDVGTFSSSATTTVSCTYGKQYDY